jgi:hypothetical protein
VRPVSPSEALPFCDEAAIFPRSSWLTSAEAGDATRVLSRSAEGEGHLQFLIGLAQHRQDRPQQDRPQQAFGSREVALAQSRLAEQARHFADGHVAAPFPA